MYFALSALTVAKRPDPGPAKPKTGHTDNFCSFWESVRFNLDDAAS